MRLLAPRQQASRAATYWRSLKMRVTLIVTPPATSSSNAAIPPGVAGTLIFQQRVQLEAHPPVVPARPLPDRFERRLGAAHQPVRQAPGDGVVVQPFADESGQLIIEAAGLDQLADDDRVGRRPGGAEFEVPPDLV